jgi:hypothetical protein
MLSMPNPSERNIPPWIRTSPETFNELFGTNATTIKPKEDPKTEMDLKAEAKIEQLVNESMQEKTLSEFVEDIKKELMKILKEDTHEPKADQKADSQKVQQEIKKSEPSSKELKGNKEIVKVQDEADTEQYYQEQTEEEANYLREIERKLKDIQERLKRTDTDGDFEETVKVEDVLEDPDIAKIEEIYKSAEEVTPFKDENMDILWRKIALSDLISLPKLSYEWCTQPFITFSYYKYNHLLLGKDKYLSQYYVGIPDIYHPDRRYILSTEQVDRFVCCENTEPQIGEYGYWIIRL